MNIEYMCRICGQKVTRSDKAGKPMPGNCPRKAKIAGRMQPHTWVVNRRY